MWADSCNDPNNRRHQHSTNSFWRPGDSLPRNIYRGAMAVLSLRVRRFVIFAEGLDEKIEMHKSAGFISTVYNLRTF